MVFGLIRFADRESKYRILVYSFDSRRSTHGYFLSIQPDRTLAAETVNFRLPCTKNFKIDIQGFPA